MNKYLKMTLKILGGILGLLIVIVGGYFIYAYAQYHRLPNDIKETINRPKVEQVELGKTYKMMTFNIGYGSYPPSFSFFMDGGPDVRAYSKQAVKDAINEDIRLIKTQNPDFGNIQEIDWQGDRSQHVDEPKMVRDALTDYSSVLTQNYDSAYLFYPVTKPIGKAKSGIMTYSKYKIESSTRYKLPIETNFNKFFDLDRAFDVNILPIKNSDKKFVIFNTHLSAFIKDQKIQKQQLLTLFDSMQKYVDAGDYVICGADYNHALAGKAHPELTWMKEFPTENLTKGMRVVAPTNAPTVRSLDVPYDAKNPKNIFGTIDGFLVSDNIKSLDVKTIDNQFKSSDHEPVVMNFELIK
ncbi:endonuclease/exonuclease/phosphatase family protein [Lactococcus protaetiae]|uniref:Endonuclease/exonuclease/phosphatase family protein n=1 Tax=Lactococcus protaetiae TaxID=2592653 RepID=A0A514ZA10_9LACT|nr:endonuclease/exonuclease/phosphatase family protein [Lactococcus protaetiae]QDK71420.1 endonuclease/exonuclease/phosphatase family protein [Lactococcus protaetiae]